MKELTAANVDALVQECMTRDGDVRTTDDVEVRGIVYTFSFNMPRVREHKLEIRELLSQLPHQFMSSTAVGGGGGWSFVKACQREDGVQWTGLHLTMEALFTLGQAAGEVQLLMGREYWSALPGGMPYYAVLDTDEARASAQSYSIAE